MMAMNFSEICNVNLRPVFALIYLQGALASELYNSQGIRSASMRRWFTTRSGWLGIDAIIIDHDVDGAAPDRCHNQRPESCYSFHLLASKHRFVFVI
jgi:hypothetical protein